jgi:hypothetical protein
MNKTSELVFTSIATGKDNKKSNKMNQNVRHFINIIKCMNLAIKQLNICFHPFNTVILFG